MVDELGSREEINVIHEMLETGTGADRQLRVWEETHDLKKVVDDMAEQTRYGTLGLTPHLHFSCCHSAGAKRRRNLQLL